MRRFTITRYLLVVLAMVFLSSALPAHAGDVPEKTLVAEDSLKKINEYFSAQTLTFSDGASISREIISGPPTPPPGFESERSRAVPEPSSPADVHKNIVPAYTWVFGCSAVSASMVAAFYDRNGYSNIYTGLSNGGIMPLIEDPLWGTWTDGSDTYPNNPLIASRNGLDGRTRKGSIDDYWVLYGSLQKDPYIGHWSEHTPGDAIGDYMKTSQSTHGNTDGATTFYNWVSDPGRLTCDEMKKYGIANVDGTYGRKLFYEARGYDVADCYNQKTDNNGGEFNFAMYKTEIDAGHPVLLNLAGHSIVGIGYDDASATVYLHDTWDQVEHTMPWGGSYSGLQLQSVSIVQALNPPPDVRSFSPASGAAGTVITISGADFGLVQGASTVTIGGVDATVTSWSKTKIKTTVPPTGTTGIVAVHTEGGSGSNGKTFTVKAPVVSSLSPAAGTLGIPLHITGSNFGTPQGTSKVTIGGVEATASSWSNTKITCTVPATATTGPVIVTTDVGDSNNTKIFTVKAPLVSSVSPSSGAIGAAVAVSGKYFGLTQGTSTITFNGVEATATSWSDTRIACTVPVGAATGPVIVTTDVGDSNNTKIFTVK